MRKRRDTEGGMGWSGSINKSERAHTGSAQERRARPPLCVHSGPSKKIRPGEKGRKKKDKRSYESKQVEAGRLFTERRASAQMEASRTALAHQAANERRKMNPISPVSLFWSPASCAGSRRTNPQYSVQEHQLKLLPVSFRSLDGISLTESGRSLCLLLWAPRPDYFGRWKPNGLGSLRCLHTE